MNARNKEVDKTYLSLDLARERGFLHRDYIAHCLRWSHVVKKLMEKKTYAHAKILDVGCGRELPLARTLYSSRIIPLEYVGVDAGPIETDILAGLKKTGKFPIEVFDNTDVLKLRPGEDQFTYATMFEVAEHVEPKHFTQMMIHIKNVLLAPGGTMWLSTPCWNIKDTANNHVNEMTYPFLGSLLEAIGWNIEEVYGTFASIRDYQDQLTRCNLNQVFDQLREYYDTNVLSVIFAPLFPAQSRNCLWQLRNTQRSDKFDELMEGRIDFHRCGSTTTKKWEDWYRFMCDEGLLA